MDAYAEGEIIQSRLDVVDECAKASFHVVVVAPHIGPFSISDGPANSGDMVSATCSIMKGDFPVEIVWKFNGRAIGFNDPDLTITRINRHMSALSIESVAARHAGEYTCVATNRAGNVTHSTTLAVNGIYTKETSTLARQTSFAHCHRLIKEKTEKKRKKKDSIPIIPSSTFLFSPPLPFVVRRNEETRNSFLRTHTRTRTHAYIYFGIAGHFLSCTADLSIHVRRRAGELGRSDLGDLLDPEGRLPYGHNLGVGRFAHRFREKRSVHDHEEQAAERVGDRRRGGKARG